MLEERKPVSVTALNRYVRSLLDGDPRLTDIRLRGEISNFVHHRSGHCYFSLKDENSSIKAVMFRSDAQQLRFAPENGMQVVADCRVSLFERDGSYQAYVQYLFPDGAGAIRLAFEKLRARLEQEGLFEEAHKRPLPAMPRTIGVVTSASGAALQDIRNVLGRRYPLAKLLLAPVNVQGAEAAPEIAAAIAQLDQSGLADVIIVARGGGSAEDLWVFNDERVARAAYRCRTPLVSAIGHEIDFTILDFVADRRAPTPSAAAEIVAPDIRQLYGYNLACADRARQLLAERLAAARQRLVRLRTAPVLADPQRLVCARRAQLAALAQTAQDAAAGALRQRQRRLGSCAQLAASLDPYAVLARGYAVLQQDGAPLDVGALQVGDTLTAKTADALLTCQVQKIERKEQKG